MRIQDDVADYVASAAPGEVRFAANHIRTNDPKRKILIILANDEGAVALTDAFVIAAEKYKAEGDMERFLGLKQGVEKIAAALGVSLS